MTFQHNKYFITGIGTNIGKTISSAILVNALQADYWKPVQCGNLEDSDSKFIRDHSNANVFPERFRLKMPASPHAAAAAENISISLDDFILPETNNILLVEGAGGMLVPLNENRDYVIDIAVKFEIPLIIVSSFYLGSINHTLLTLEYAKSLNLEIALLLFSGEINESSLAVIQKFHPSVKIAFIPEMKIINKDSILIAAENFRKEYLV